ncbi:MAG: hypothetical protein HQL38_12340 [Alphaproteobacteria bacterium]|nr:hypothetical protein [Alphaproteobacteria bacterium]
MSFAVLALRLARRDLAGALGGFWILIAGIAKGRIIGLPKLGWETAPGDPDAESDGLEVA